jgi:hypothetical protein
MKTVEFTPDILQFLLHHPSEDREAYAGRIICQHIHIWVLQILVIASTCWSSSAWFQTSKTCSLCVFLFLFRSSFFVVLYWGLNTEPHACWASAYHLNHIPSTFCFSYFSDKVLCFFLWLTWDLDHPTYAVCVAEITDMYHCTWLVSLDECLANLLSGLASKCDPLDLCLLSSWNYRHELPYLAFFICLLDKAVHTIPGCFFWAPVVHSQWPNWIMPVSSYELKFKTCLY